MIAIPFFKQTIKFFIDRYSLTLKLIFLWCKHALNVVMGEAFAFLVFEKIIHLTQMKTMILWGKIYDFDDCHNME